jgi:uncharacterized protein (TIGR03118 family)
MRRSECPMVPWPFVQHRFRFFRGRLMKARQGLSRVLVAFATVVLPAATRWAGVVVANLVTDDQGVNAATIMDPNLKNPWGISYAPGGPFWVSDNASGTTTLYRVDSGTNVPTTVPLVVTIPGDGTVTGQVFNSVGAGAMNGDNFLFVSEDGTISGWRGALVTVAETLQVGSAANVYKGAAFASVGGHAYLYSANFRSGAIDVLKGDAGAPSLPGSFVDPGIPAGFAPFNVQNLGGKLYVAYALQDGAKHDDVAGPGNGIVSSFDLNGNFLGRVATAGVLNSPWGMAIAPSSFGPIAGDLLIGNFGDGTINAFTPNTFLSDGPILDSRGDPVVIDGLWALIPGNGGTTGNSNSIYFSAGSNAEADGLFGSLTPVPEPTSLAMLVIGTCALAGWRLRRRRSSRSGRWPHAARKS